MKKDIKKNNLVSNKKEDLEDNTNKSTLTVEQIKNYESKSDSELRKVSVCSLSSLKASNNFLTIKSKKSDEPPTDNVVSFANSNSGDNID